MVPLLLALCAGLAAPARPEGPAGAGAATASTPGEKLLRAVAEPFRKLRTFEADFLQDQTWVGSDDVAHYRGTLFLMRPNRFRIEYQDPKGNVQVSDGTQVWTYVPENGQVLLAPLDASANGRDFLQTILDESVPEAAVVETKVDGRPARLLTLDPPSDLELQRVRLWIEKDRDRILQYELDEVSGNRSTYRLTHVRENPDLSPSLFRFEPPQGVPVVEVGAP